MDLNNENSNESIFENIVEENTWSNLSEISTLVIEDDNISTCSNHSLCYSHSDSDSDSDTNNDILNTANIDIKPMKNSIRPADSHSSRSMTDKEINPSPKQQSHRADLNLQRFKVDLDIGADTGTSPSQNYYFDKISNLTDKYITLNSNLNSTNNRVELLQVSSEYTEYHVNDLYQSLSESKHVIDTLNQDIAIKNDEIVALRKEFKEMKNRMENMELRFENTVAHLRNTVDIHKIDTQNRINSLLIHRPKSL